MKPDNMAGLIITLETRIKYDIGELEGMVTSLHNDMEGLLTDIHKKKEKVLLSQCGEVQGQGLRIDLRCMKIDLLQKHLEELKACKEA